jgi:hypothetical protein
MSADTSVVKLADKIFDSENDNAYSQFHCTCRNECRSMHLVPVLYGESCSSTTTQQLLKMPLAEEPKLRCLHCTKKFEKYHNLSS